ncbi:NAD-P-binding protein [Panus rudis PR-1116 ss-1]|nr:NAD-P-binding protein [Panus rudis PR-1116 ss-1]
MSFPSKIEAFTFANTGPVEVMEKTTVPFPQPQPDNIVVKVNWGGVNTIDTYFRKGLYPVKSFPVSSGVEASGTIVALPTDEEVLNDPKYKERGYKIGGRVSLYSLGAHAEYASVIWHKVFPLPDSLSLQLAAAATLQGLTAITLMTESYNVQKGDVILIHTVAGGLGLLFTQYAKSRGATVIGTTSTKEKAELAISYGADHVILYPNENTVDRVLEITNGEGVHAVYDGVGKDTFMDNFKLVRRKGTLINVGNASGPVEPISPLKLVEKNLKLVRPSMANYIVTPEESQYYTKELFTELSSGRLKVKIHGVYPFTTEGVRQAQTDLTTPGGKVAGKLLYKIADE